MVIEREILDMLGIGLRQSQVISGFFLSKIAKIAKDKCSHCSIILLDGYRRPF